MGPFRNLISEILGVTRTLVKIGWRGFVHNKVRGREKLMAAEAKCAG